MKILAVDDDDLLLELLVEVLSAHGYSDISTASSAAGALDLIRALDGDDAQENEGTFDCFLLDIQMPKMDGIELCERIRSIPSYKKAPILMITAMTDRSFVDGAFNSGATDYITKPFDNLELVTRIRLANALVNEQRKGLENYFLVSSMLSGMNDVERLEFEEPIAIDGIPGVVDYLVLENYLLQLPRRSVYQSMAIGFRLLNADEIFNNCSRADFHQLVAGIAVAIAEVLDETDCVLSYFGSGYFVCVMDKINAGSLQNVEQTVNQSIVALGLASSENPVRIVMGKPATNLVQSSDDIHSMILGAIDSVAKTVSRGKKRPQRKRVSVKALKYNVIG